MITILSNRAIPIIMLLCSAKNTDAVDINIKSAGAYSGKRFFQNICKMCSKRRLGRKSNIYQGRLKFSDDLFANSSRPVQLFIWF